MSPDEFRFHVIEPTLGWLKLGGNAAEELLLGTAVHESEGLKYLGQIHGPALGVYQMEPRTYEDHLRYLTRRPALQILVRALRAPEPDGRTQLKTNLAYATALARIHYLRKPQALPPAGDLAAQARYWKAHYNTALGAGTVADFIAKNRRYR